MKQKTTKTTALKATKGKTTKPAGIVKRSKKCEHGLRKTRCLACGGSEMCLVHGCRKSRCKECNGSERCEHGRLRWICRDCKGSGYCHHDRLKTKCRDCGGSAFCEHDRQKDHCVECGGSSICVHGAQRHHCVACKGTQICEHVTRKYRCKDCNGKGRCGHGKEKYKCIQCSPITCEECGKVLPRYHRKFHYDSCHKKCENDGCIMEGCSGIFQYRFCYPCGCHLYGRTPALKRQDHVFEYISEKFSELGPRFDQPVPNQNCSRKRPDIYFDLPYRAVFVEIDENQHRATFYSCASADMYDRYILTEHGHHDQKENGKVQEYARMQELHMAAEARPAVFVRYNPDQWKDEQGKPKTCDRNSRLKQLKRTLWEVTSPDYEQKQLLEVIYLYFDGPKIQKDFVPVDTPQ